jgi:DnaK suppressor protein
MMLAMMVSASFYFALDFRRPPSALCHLPFALIVIGQERAAAGCAVHPTVVMVDRRRAPETLQHLQDESQNHPDIADRASSETDRAIELRARDRQRKLIAKIDAALRRIDDGTYGYCEETGEPISLKRLDARPIATLSIEAQQRHERRERVYRDD